MRERNDDWPRSCILNGVLYLKRVLAVRLYDVLCCVVVIECCVWLCKCLWACPRACARAPVGARGEVGAIRSKADMCVALCLFAASGRSLSGA